MLNATCSETTLFKNLIMVLKELVVDCVIQCKHDGLFLQAMDASHVALCSFQLHREGFKSYTCETEFEIGLHLPSLERILKCAKKEDIVSLKSQHDDDVLNIEFENTRSNKTSHYELKRMLIDHEYVELNTIDYSTRIQMHAVSFSEVCKDMQIIGDTCQITSSANTLQWSVHGDIGNGQTILHHDDAFQVDDDSKKDRVHITTSVSCNLTFSLKYLIIFAKAMSLSTGVELSIQEDSPLEVKYVMPKIGSLCFYVAPKINEQ